MKSRQFERNVILFFTTEDESKIKGEGSTLKYFKAISAVIKKTSTEDSPTKFFSFNNEDVTLGTRIPLITSKCEVELKTPDSLSKTRFYINAHGDEKDDFLHSLGLTTKITAEELAQFFSSLLGSTKTSRTEPLYISLIACYSTAFAHKLQKALFEKGIYSNIKARKTIVLLYDEGIKFTCDDDKKSIHKQANTKVLLYTDENDQPRELDYKYTDKNFYTVDNAKLSIEASDSKFLASFVNFSTAKYSKIPAAADLLALALKQNNVDAIYQLLRSEYVRKNYVTLVEDLMSTKNPFPYSQLMDLAIKNNEIIIVKFLHKYGFNHFPTPSSDEELIALHKASHLFQKLDREISELKFSSTIDLNDFLKMEFALYEKKPSEFIKKYQFSSALEFKKMVEVKIDLTTKISAALTTLQKSKRYSEVEIQQFNEYMTQKFDVLHQLLLTGDPAQVKTETLIEEHIQNFENQLADRKKKLLLKLRAYILEPENDFKPLNNKFSILSSGIKKSVPQIIYEHFQLLKTLDAKEVDINKLYKEIIQATKIVKQKPSFTFWGLRAPSKETTQYINNLSDESFDFLNKKNEGLAKSVNRGKK